MKSRTMIYRAAESAVASPALPERSQSARLYQFPYRTVTYPSDVRIDDPNEEFGHPSLLIEVAAAVMAFVFWLGWRVSHLWAESH